MLDNPLPRSASATARSMALTAIPRPSRPQEKYLIMDCPSDATLPSYMPTLEEQGVRHVVRVSGYDHEYDTAPLAAANIRVHDDMRFEDGTAPPPHVVFSWLSLVERTFDVAGNIAVTRRASRKPSLSDAREEDASNEEPKSIACHCVSGIGRAPILVALALVEFDGLDPLEAVELVRKRRHGALNKQQLQWLSSYKRGRWRKRKTPLLSATSQHAGHSPHSENKRRLPYFFQCCSGKDHV